MHFNFVGTVTVPARVRHVSAFVWRSADELRISPNMKAARCLGFLRASTDVIFTFAHVIVGGVVRCKSASFRGTSRNGPSKAELHRVCIYRCCIGRCEQTRAGQRAFGRRSSAVNNLFAPGYSSPRIAARASWAAARTRASWASEGTMRAVRTNTRFSRNVRTCCCRL